MAALQSASLYSTGQQQAAAVFRSIICQMFADGSKRTAVEAIKLMAQELGLIIKVSEARLMEIALQVAKNELTNVTEIAKLIFEK